MPRWIAAPLVSLVVLALAPATLRADEHLLMDLDPTRVYDVLVDGDTVLSGLQPSPEGILVVDTPFSGSFQLVEAGQGDVTPPGTIVDLTTSEVGGSTAVLEWTAPGDDGATGFAMGYEISWSTHPDALGSTGNLVQSPPAPAAPGTPETFLLRGLPSSTQLYAAIRARDDAGLIGALSNVASFRTNDSGGDPPNGPPDDPPDTGPGVPPGAPAAAFEEGAIRLEWSAAATAALGYHVYRRPEGGAVSRLTESPIDATVYVDADVTLGSGYYYRVTAVDEEMNESPASPETWVRATSSVPPVLVLERVYPSPIREEAVFRFAVPEVGPGHAGGVRVTLDLYDVAGRRVGRVIDGLYPPGVQEVRWTPGRSGRAFAPGIYVSVLRAAGRSSRANVAIAR